MKIANTEYNTLGAYKLLLKTIKEKPLTNINNETNTASYVFFNKNKEIALLTVSETHEKRGYFATISVRTIRKSATDGYFVKDLGKMNLRSVSSDKDALNILNLELDYLYRGNHYASRMAAVAVELAAKQGFKYLIAYAPADPIISFKNINNKVTESQSLGDRTEQFFKSCGFRDVGTYKQTKSNATNLRVYARNATQPIAIKYNGEEKPRALRIENESRQISAFLINKLEKHGEIFENVAK